MRRIALLLVLGACSREAELQTYDCAADDSCVPCATDEECVVFHNPCGPIAICAHESENLAVDAIGCPTAREYATPPDSACECVQQTCQAAE